MTTIVNAIERRLAQRIRQERSARAWSLAELSERSGVSKAMISKIERAESSPTAALLGQLSGAFGITLSTLLQRAEAPESRVSRAGEQSVWQDPQTGLRRTSVSPSGAEAIEIVRCDLPAGKRIAYPASAYVFIHQQLYVLKGTLHFTEGGDTHALRAGDCLRLGTPTDCMFENRERAACLYLVVISRR